MRVTGPQQKYTWPTPMKIPIKRAGTSTRLAKRPARAVHLAVLPVGTLGGATWSCSAHLSSTWPRLPRLPIPSSRLIQRQEGESSKSELCCARRSSRTRRSPSHTIGSTTVPPMQTRIGRFTAPQVAVLESVVVAPLSQHSDSVPTEFPSEYAGHGPAAEVHMANSHEDPHQAGRNEHEVGKTSGARRPPRRSASRHTRRSNVELFRTPLLNLAAAAQIADSLQPTDSEAGRGIEQIRALLRTAQQQNSAVSQSHNRIHNSSAHANTHRSVHSPGSYQHHRGGSRSMIQEDRHRSRTPPWGGPYGS